jgi:hypothetical protein
VVGERAERLWSQGDLRMQFERRIEHHLAEHV